MKKVLRTLVSGLCAMGILISLCGVLAVEKPVETVHVDLVVWSHFVLVDGVSLLVEDSTHEWADFLSYQGSIYLPARTAGELMGATVEWNDTTLTLTTGKAVPFVRNTFGPRLSNDLSNPEVLAKIQSDRLNGVDIPLRSDIAVVVDGVTQHFTNVLGQPLYPLFFREELYLPVRSIGELCGKAVFWIPEEPFEFAPIEHPDYELLNQPYQCVGRGSQIHLIDPPTQAQLDEVQTFMDTANQLYTEIVAAGAAQPDLNTCTAQEAADYLQSICTPAETLRTLKRPDAPFFLMEANRIRTSGWDIKDYRIDHYFPRLKAVDANPAIILDEFKDLFLFISVYDLRGNLVAGQRLLDAARTTVNPR